MKKKQRQMLLGFTGLIVASLVIGGFVGYGPFSALQGYLPQPPVPEPEPGTYKTIAVTGGYNIPQGTTPGAIGTAIFFDSTGNVISSGALSAASVFSVSITSGKSYQVLLTMTGGNAITFYQTVEQISVPAYYQDSEVTTYNVEPAFVVYPKAVTWGERVTFGTFATGTSIVTYTANAWGGTQTHSAAGDCFTAIVAATQYTITFELSCITPYSQLGNDLTLPNYNQYTMGTYAVLWMNRTAQDWSIVDPGDANAKAFIVNGSTTVFAAKLPVVRSGASAVSLSRSFTIMTGSAGQGQWGAHIVMNSTYDWFSGGKDYKVNAPPGYGACWYGDRFVTGHLG